MINKQFCHYSMHPVFEMQRDKFLLFQPLAHIYGVAILTVSLAIGATFILVPQFTLEGYIKLVEKYRVC